MKYEDINPIAYRKLVEHTCAQCGKEFVARKEAIYCSNACRQRAKYLRNKDKKN